MSVQQNEVNFTGEGALRILNFATHIIRRAFDQMVVEFPSQYSREFSTTYAQMPCKPPGVPQCLAEALIDFDQSFIKQRHFQLQ